MRHRVHFRRPSIPAASGYHASSFKMLVSRKVNNSQPCYIPLRPVIHCNRATYPTGYPQGAVSQNHWPVNALRPASGPFGHGPWLPPWLNGRQLWWVQRVLLLLLLPPPLLHPRLHPLPLPPRRSDQSPGPPVQRPPLPLPQPGVLPRLPLPPPLPPQGAWPPRRALSCVSCAQLFPHDDEKLAAVLCFQASY